MNIQRVSLAQANQFISQHHRHHGPVVGHKFSLGAYKMGRLVGVCTVGRPVARMLDNGATLEVTRLCTDGTRNACSALYGAARREASAYGSVRVITYILDSELGTSLAAAGWIPDRTTPGGSWSRPSRPRTDNHPTEAKRRYQAKTLPRRELSVEQMEF